MEKSDLPKKKKVAKSHEMAIKTMMKVPICMYANTLEGSKHKPGKRVVKAAIVTGPPICEIAYTTLESLWILLLLDTPFIGLLGSWIALHFLAAFLYITP